MAALIEGVQKIWYILLKSAEESEREGKIMKLEKRNKKDGLAF